MASEREIKNLNNEAYQLRKIRGLLQWIVFIMIIGVLLLFARG